MKYNQRSKEMYGLYKKMFYFFFDSYINNKLLACGYSVSTLFFDTFV